MMKRPTGLDRMERTLGAKCGKAVADLNNHTN